MIGYWGIWLDVGLQDMFGYSWYMDGCGWICLDVQFKQV